MRRIGLAAALLVVILGVAVSCGPAALPTPTSSAAPTRTPTVTAGPQGVPTSPPAGPGGTATRRTAVPTVSVATPTPLVAPTRLVTASPSPGA